MFYIGKTFDKAKNKSFATYDEALAAKNTAEFIFNENGEKVESELQLPPEPVGIVRVIYKGGVYLRSTAEIGDNVVGVASCGSEFAAFDWKDGFVPLAIGGYVKADGSFIEFIPYEYTQAQDT